MRGGVELRKFVFSQFCAKVEVVSLLAFIELLTECYERVEWEVKGYKNLVGNCNEDDVRINDSKIVLLAR